MEFAPDPIAYQLNVRDGALILKVSRTVATYLCSVGQTETEITPDTITCASLQVPPGSTVEKAGLVPTGRGFAGNIILGDVIVAVDGKPVSAC